MDYRLPMNVDNDYWLIIWHGISFKSLGKWTIFCDKKDMNEYWESARDLYLEGELQGVVLIKCSTQKPNPHASSDRDGVINFYCDCFEEKNFIKDVGRKILESLQYTSQEFIYFKTAASGQQYNHMYFLQNSLYK